MSRRARPDTARSRSAGAARADDARGERAARGRRPGAGIGSRALLLVVLATVLFSQLWLLAPLRALPSQAYGGDLYYQLGCVRRILETGNPMASCSTCETRPGYLPLYGTLVAVAARAGIGGVERPERAMMAMAVVFKLGATLALVALLTPVAGALPAAAAAAVAYALQPGLILRYTSFASEVLTPLFLLALLRLLERPGPRRALWLALAVAAAGYAHAVVFIGGVAIAGLASLARALVSPRDPVARSAPLWTALAVAAGVALALGYWYEPIFVHHGRTSAHYTEWNGGPTLTTLPARLAMAGRFFAAQADFSALAAAFASLLVPVGLGFAWRRRREPAVAAALLVLAAAFLYVFHYFVTEPALGVNFVPEYAASMLWGTARVLAIALAIAGLASLVRSAGARGAIAAGVAIAGLLMSAGSASTLAESPEMLEGRTPENPAFDRFRGWVRAHTKPDDVFLSSQEISFTISAMTGRQVLVTRRAQNDAFADMDARVRDAALILYGTNDSLRRAAIARWKVRYLFWNERWLATEYDRGEDGGITGYYDPLLYFRNESTDSLLAAAGVKLTHLTSWVDPALRTPDVKQFPLTLVSHENYRSFQRPWNATLDPMLRKVWVHEAAGKEIGAIYAIEPR